MREYPFAKHTLYHGTDIANRTSDLGRQIGGYYVRAYRQAGLESKDFPTLVVICIMDGGIYFGADLTRCIELPLEVTSITAKSYGSNTESSGNVQIAASQKLDVKDRYVLIVDDLCDTGLTLSKVTANIKDRGALDVKTCVLLNKPARNNTGFRADFIGFDDVPNEFLVGYGLDLRGRFREINDIVVPDDSSDK